MFWNQAFLTTLFQTAEVPNSRGKRWSWWKHLQVKKWWWAFEGRSWSSRSPKKEHEPLLVGWCFFGSRFRTLVFWVGVYWNQWVFFCDGFFVCVFLWRLSVLWPPLTGSGKIWQMTLLGNCTRSQQQGNKLHSSWRGLYWRQLLRSFKF